MTKSVVIYTSRTCGYCFKAKKLLEMKGISFEEIDVSNNQVKRQEMMKLSGRHTVPQIWIGDEHIGGCDDLYRLERVGSLDSILGQVSA